MNFNNSTTNLLDLNLPATSETPEVKCFKDTAKITLHGNLIPSDPQSFFAPIIRWLQVYSNNYKPQKIDIELYLTYINGCSEHHLVSFLKKAEELLLKGTDVHIKCLYEPDDIDMMNWSKDLKLVFKIPVELIEIN
ncbi:MAG: DUF1987 family protein [Bacteroidales bacterium]|nr:DUF1987 family protein [Bacteroidales bacterium]HPD96168.1 SiaC family regulatory phosphoprotein [Tenuifilaceae bacterium]HRX30265.1 SiaC family regulatory phosphoprotein [Tenuifilaceae bacterium]